MNKIKLVGKFYTHGRWSLKSFTRPRCSVAIKLGSMSTTLSTSFRREEAAPATRKTIVTSFFLHERRPGWKLSPLAQRVVLNIDAARGCSASAASCRVYYKGWIGGRFVLWINSLVIDHSVVCFQSAVELLSYHFIKVFAEIVLHRWGLLCVWPWEERYFYLV